MWTSYIQIENLSLKHLQFGKFYKILECAKFHREAPDQQTQPKVKNLQLRLQMPHNKNSFISDKQCKFLKRKEQN